MTKFVLWRIIAAFAALSWGMFGSCIADSPTVCNNLGSCFVGRYLEGYQTDLFEAFMGIPYAKPPVGARRFKNPEPYQARMEGEILNATMPAADCIQKNYLLPANRRISGSEDCLYLNVYRPEEQDDTKTLLPVLVYIHGGGWFTGTSNPGIVGPEYFMDTGKVIIVTMNYRLGPFGFLSSGDASMPGNFGLKDQNMALKWVQKNIIFFNGDPNKVSLMGQSSGGVSVHMQMLSRQSKGLFQSAIALSGTANVPFAITNKPAEQFKQLARLCKIANYNKLTSLALTDVFRSLKAEEILECAEGFKYWDVDNLVNFRAVVENQDDPEAFLVEHPDILLKKGKFMQIPFLMTTVPGEGAVRAIAILENSTLRTSFNKNFHQLFLRFLEIPETFSPAEAQEIANLAVEHYFGGIPELNSKTAQGFLDLVTDRGFQFPLLKVIESYRNNPQKYYPTVLHFNYKGPYSFTSIYTNAPNPRDYGVVHGDDLLYLFRSTLLFPDFSKISVEASLIQFYTQFMLDFAFGQDYDRKVVVPRINFGGAFGKSKHSRYPRSDCSYLALTDSKESGFQINFKNSLTTERLKFWTLLELK